MSRLLSRMTQLVAVTCLLLATVSAEDASQRARKMVEASRQRERLRSRETLSLAVAPAPGKYAEGAPLPFTLKFKNIGKKTMTFELPYRSEDPPGFLQARMWDEGGVLLTANDTIKDGWWTALVMSSAIMGEVKKEDLITLKPDEEYAHTVDLRRLLAGCGCLPNCLKAGVYRVQFSFGRADSNEIEIVIGN
jgi:hypothetical protein